MRMVVFIIAPCLVLAIEPMRAGQRSGGAGTNQTTESQPPAPPPQRMGQGDQQQPPDQRGTASEPLIVRVLPAEPTQEQTDQQQADRYEQAKRDRWSVRFTGSIAFFTFGLLVVAVFQWRTYRQQAKLMRESLTETAKAADAAQSSANTASQTLIATQRAFVTLKGVRTKRMVRKDGLLEGWEFTLAWHNTGQTPALRARHGAGSSFREKGQPVEGFTPPDIVETEWGVSTIGPGTEVVSQPVALSVGAHTMAMEGQVRYLYGFMAYDDVFNGTPRHRSTVCVVMIANHYELEHSKEPFQFVAYDDWNDAT